MTVAMSDATGLLHHAVTARSANAADLQLAVIDRESTIFHFIQHPR
jgi:hypothetical protein